MTDPGLRRRRLLSLLGAGAAGPLAGCSRLFTEPEGDATPTATPTQTATPTPTATRTPATTTAPTATPVSGVRPITVAGYTLSFETVPGDFTAAEVDVSVSNEADRTIRRAEFRIALVFRPTATNRTVTVDYVGSRFGDGIEAGVTEQLAYRTRFPTDGRAEGSTDPAEFGLRYRVVRLEFG